LRRRTRVRRAGSQSHRDTRFTLFFPPIDDTYRVVQQRNDVSWRVRSFVRSLDKNSFLEKAVAAAAAASDDDEEETIHRICDR